MSRTVKTAARKTPAKKTTARKTSKRPATKKVARKARKFQSLDLKPIKAKLSRTELVERLAEQTETDRKTARAFIEALGNTMKASLMPRACGEFTIPGLLVVKTRKIAAKKMPAIKKGTLVRRPGSPEPVEHPGRKAYVKPATVKVRVRSLAKVKRAALGTE